MIVVTPIFHVQYFTLSVFEPQTFCLTNWPLLPASATRKQTICIYCKLGLSGKYQNVLSPLQFSNNLGIK